MKISNEDNLYLTSDLALAAFLALSYPLKQIKKTNNDKALFCFKKNKNLGNKVKEYLCSSSLVEPQSYFNSIKAMKNLIYNNYYDS